MSQKVKTNLDITVYNIDEASQNNDEVKNVPGVSEIVLKSNIMLMY